MLAAAQDPTKSEIPWEQARCRDAGGGNPAAGSMLGLFFSEELADIARAKAICALCPLSAPCLEGALSRQEPWGVWGGQLFADGKVLAFKRKRGRPPKQVRSPLVGEEPVRLTA